DGKDAVRFHCQIIANIGVARGIQGQKLVLGRDQRDRPGKNPALLQILHLRADRSPLGRMIVSSTSCVRRGEKKSQTEKQMQARGHDDFLRRPGEAVRRADPTKSTVVTMLSFVSGDLVDHVTTQLRNPSKCSSPFASSRQSLS